MLGLRSIEDLLRIPSGQGSLLRAEMVCLLYVDSYLLLFTILIINLLIAVVRVGANSSEKIF